MPILPPIDPTIPVSAYDPTQALHTPSGVLPPILSGGNVVDPNAAAHGEDLSKRGLLSHMLGKEIYQAEKPPEPTAPLGTPEYFQQRGQQLTYDKEHPWGSAISEHPGVLGKIFHGIAKAGNIAGDILAPGTMALIPGTDLNKTLQERENLAGEERAQQLQNQETEANATEENADTAKERADTEKATEEKPVKLSDEEQTYASLSGKVNPATNKPYTPLEAYQTVKQAGQKPEKPDSIDEQYASAISAGDHVKAQQILQVKRDLAAAGQAPQRPGSS